LEVIQAQKHTISLLSLETPLSSFKLLPESA
jgi:hypothetical protein